MSKKNKETYNFQTKTKKMLDIMVHSIYTHNEIFLRELISNSADALNKVRFKSLTEKDIMDEDEDLKIKIEVDKQNRTLSVIDNGIGMTYQEVIDNIGTVAQSGSSDFIEKLQKKEDAFELIGEFGVGFYSSFMVSKKVTVFTKSPRSNGVRWESKGEGQFTIEEYNKEERGTIVKLHLREGEEFDKFLKKHKIQNLVTKYSNYIPYPIVMDFEKKVEKEDSGEKKTVTKEQVLNSMTPIWKKSKNEVEEEDYIEFYKNNFHDWNDPFDIIHTKVEGLVTYDALMFIPSETPPNYYQKDFKPGINLYSKQVFIMKHCDNLLPDYLNFIKGVVDSPDFSLNISREMLQKNSQIKRIGNNLEKKILKKLEKKLENDRDNYEDWWKKFGTPIKSGIAENPSLADKLENLLLFESSNSKDSMTTLKEYESRMPKDQEEIYYLVTTETDNPENLPQIESTLDKGYEVLFFNEPVDEFVANNMDDYNNKKLKSLNKSDSNIDESEETKKAKKESKNLLETIKNNLEGKIDEVKISNRLKKSAVCLVTDESGMSIHTEELLKKAQNIPFQSKKILEINPDHKIFKIMKEEYDKNKNSELIKEYSDLLYDQAMIMEGMSIDNPTEFANKISELMVKAKEDKNE